MYVRQWFPPSSQVALGDDALDLEESIYTKQYDKAIKIAGTFLEYKKKEPFNKMFWKRQNKRILRLQSRSPADKNITVSFTNFWIGFDKFNNEVLNLLKEAAKQIGYQIIVVDKDADLEILSCFKSDTSKIPISNSGQTKILYLGENVRPFYADIDYSLSFDKNAYLGRNIYCPLWLLRSSKLGIKEQNEYIPYTPERLWNRRNKIRKERNVVYVGNNSTPMRIELIRTLINAGYDVKCYGSHTSPVENKLTTMSEYTFSICIENSYHPGYVTEKLIDGYLANTVPIYWGGADHHVFNENSFINISSHDEISKLPQKLNNISLEYQEGQILLKNSTYNILYANMVGNVAGLLRKLF